MRTELSGRHTWLRLAALALSLAGCADTAASPKGHSLQHIAGLKLEAFRKANKGCNQYGRAAEIAAYDAASQDLSFRCIEP